MLVSGWNGVQIDHGSGIRILRGTMCWFQVISGDFGVFRGLRMDRKGAMRGVHVSAHVYKM